MISNIITKISHSKMQNNRNDCRESYESKVKSARSSNYNILRSLAEFLDNSIEAKAKNIVIKLYLDNNKNNICYKIILIDDGHGILDIKSTATHGFTRTRDEKGGGEFGYGYKLAAINISDEYTMITKHSNGEYHQSIWNQIDMIRQDTYEPNICPINKDMFCMNQSNPLNKQSETGTVTIFKELLPQTKSSVNLDNLSRYLEKRYNLFINEGLNFDIIINDTLEKSINQTNILNLKSYISKTKGFKSTIDLYRDNETGKLDFYLISDLFKDNNSQINIKLFEQPKNKNGNYNIGKKYYEERIVKQNLFDNLEYIGQIIFNSYDYSFIEDTDLEIQIPQGNVDIIRKNYNISDVGVCYRAVYGDGYANYVYNQLIYDKSALDTYIGTNVNKQNNGSVQDNDLYKILHYIQRKHESVFRAEQRKICETRNKVMKEIKQQLSEISDNLKNLLSEGFNSTEQLNNLDSLIQKIKENDNNGDLWDKIKNIPCKYMELDNLYQEKLNLLKQNEQIIHDNLHRLYIDNKDSFETISLNDIEGLKSSIETIDSGFVLWNQIQNNEINSEIIENKLEKLKTLDTLEKLKESMEQIIFINKTDSSDNSIKSLENILVDIYNLDNTGQLWNQIPDNPYIFDNLEQLILDKKNAKTREILDKNYQDIQGLMEKSDDEFLDSDLLWLKDLITEVKQIDSDGGLSQDILDINYQFKFNELETKYYNKMSDLETRNKQKLSNLYEQLTDNITDSINDIPYTVQEILRVINNDGIGDNSIVWNNIVNEATRESDYNLDSDNLLYLHDSVCLKIKNDKLCNWNTTAYLGLFECCDKGIYIENNRIMGKFGYTNQDPKNRDSGSNLGSSWRRMASNFINESASVAVSANKIRIESDLYNDINLLDTVEWIDDSREKFSIHKDKYFVVLDIFNKICGNYRQDIDRLFIKNN